MPFPITPESSVVNQPISSSVAASASTDARSQQPPKAPVSPGTNAAAAPPPSPADQRVALQYPHHNFSAAIGVAVLTVAAVAVAWRVKPEVSV